jgi:hypothetical protein
MSRLFPSRMNATTSVGSVARFARGAVADGPALGLTPLAISPIPGGGSRLAFLGKGDGMVHVATLDASDQIVAGSAFALPA